MHKINWKVRVKNKYFWLAIVPLAFELVAKILALFGVHFEYSALVEQLKAIIEVVFIILGLLGVCVDMTTEGIADSQQALTYDEPKKADEYLS